MFTYTPELTTDHVTIKWNIASLGTVPTLDNLTNAVVAVTWQCQGQQLKINSSDVLTATRTGTIYVTPNTNSYTPFESLTELQVMTWVNENLGADAMMMTNQQVIADIYQQQHPKTLPWSN
jgi:hypothetical protein